MDKPTNPMREQEKQDASDVRKNYTRTPNMLIFGYRELSPQEKWLYTCLKHLCGAKGTRYLSLRYISEQTGISVGALSSSKDKKGNVNEGMVRHLHDAGLIHSEIKKREGKGNAQYHITITDVWALNQEFFIERNNSRSDFGQDENETSEPVRNPSGFVRISDNLVQNSDEPVRIPGQLQDYSKTINKITDKTDKQEIAYPRKSETAASGTSVPTHAPSSQDETYAPDYTASQEKSEQDSVTPELSTLQASSPQVSAKVEPRRGNSSSKVVAPQKKYVPPTAQVKPQLTLLGGQARDWYEIIRACKLRMTQANIKALNVLAELDGMDFESLKETIELIDGQELVKKRNIPIGPQELASEEGYWRFDKWYPVVVRNRKQQASKSGTPLLTSPSLPSYGHMSDEEYYASLRKGNQNARTAYAR